jgi:hypothetical protein
MDWINDVPWTDVVAYNYCTGLEAAIAHNAHRDPTWYNITATTALFYGLLTLLLNIRVYIVLLKDRKEFSSSFYVVWIAANIVVIDFESVKFDIGFEQGDGVGRV